MSTIVVVRPDWSDTACKWGSKWLEELVVKPAQKAGFKVIDLYGDNATRDKVLDAMKQPDTIYFSGVGHGNADIFTGQEFEHIFWTNDGETKEIAPGKHFNFLSCSVGERLAPWIDEVGAVGVHAYDATYWFVMGNFPNGFAEPFFDSHCTVDKALFAGKTHGEAHKECLDRYDYWIDNAPQQCKSYLFHDKQHKKFFGDPNARIMMGYLPIRVFRVWYDHSRKNNRFDIQIGAEMPSGETKFVYRYNNLSYDRAHFLYLLLNSKARKWIDPKSGIFQLETAAGEWE